jgi:hypothetical protein
LGVPRRFGLMLLAGIGLFGGARVEAADIAPQRVGGRIHWVYSYAEGKKLARETGKAMFVVFRCER